MKSTRSTEEKLGTFTTFYKQVVCIHKLKTKNEKSLKSMNLMLKITQQQMQKHWFLGRHHESVLHLPPLAQDATMKTSTHLSSSRRRDTEAVVVSAVTPSVSSLSSLRSLLPSSTSCWRQDSQFSTCSVFSDPKVPRHCQAINHAAYSFNLHL